MFSIVRGTAKLFFLRSGLFKIDPNLSMCKRVERKVGPALSCANVIRTGTHSPVGYKRGCAAFSQQHAQHYVTLNAKRLPVISHAHCQKAPSDGKPTRGCTYVQLLSLGSCGDDSDVLQPASRVMCSFSFIYSRGPKALQRGVG